MSRIIQRQALFYRKAMVKALGSKAKKISPDTLSELYFLFIANSFIRMYQDGVKTKNSRVEKLLTELDKRSSIYQKQWKKAMTITTELFNKIEENELKLKNKDVKYRYEKRIHFNENNEVEVHGLLFAVAMILQQKRLDNRVLNLPYALASEIYMDFSEKSGIMFDNARLLPIKFKRYLYDEQNHEEIIKESEKSS